MTNEDKPARLRQAREAAGYESASAAAEAFGWTASTYRHHENGTRDFGLAAAKRYARAFRVDAATLLGLAAVKSASSEADEFQQLIANIPVERHSQVRDILRTFVSQPGDAADIYATRFERELTASPKNKQGKRKSQA